MDWFRDLITAGVPCGPINTVNEGVAYAQELGLEPVVNVGPDGDAVPSIRHPISFSATPARYDLPPPDLDEHRDEIRRWLTRRDTRPEPRP